MDVLRDYPSEFAQAFQASFSLLFTVNIRFWFHDASFVTRYWRFLYIGPCVVVLALSATVDVWLLLRGGCIVEVASRVPPCLIMIQGVLKGAVLLPRARDIARLVQGLGALWCSEHAALGADQRALRTKLLRRLILCTKVNYWFALVGTCQYLLTPLVQTLTQTLMGVAGDRLLPLAARYPFDPATSAAPWPVYLAVYAFQFYSMFLCVLSYIGAELLMVSVCALLAAEFALLRAELLHAHVGHAALLHAVRRHQELVRLSEQFDDIFKKLVFVDLVFVGVTTCFFRFAAQFSRGATDMVNNYIAGLSSQLYMLCICYYGEQLTGASLSVAGAAYDSPWYNENKQYQIIIFMIITRAQRPCCLTSLMYAPVTLSMFTKVMSTTWSYFSLMNSVYQEQEQE